MFWFKKGMWCRQNDSLPAGLAEGRVLTMGSRQFLAPRTPSVGTVCSATTCLTNLSQAALCVHSRSRRNSTSCHRLAGYSCSSVLLIIVLWSVRRFVDQFVFCWYWVVKPYCVPIVVLTIHCLLGLISGVPFTPRRWADILFFPFIYAQYKLLKLLM